MGEKINCMVDTNLHRTSVGIFLKKENWCLKETAYIIDR